MQPEVKLLDRAPHEIDQIIADQAGEWEAADDAIMVVENGRAL
jgi:hypothetical protein